jgi:hypothetical protein
MVSHDNLPEHSGLMEWWTVKVPCEISTIACYTGWFTRLYASERTHIHSNIQTFWFVKWWTVDVPCRIGTAACYTGWFTSLYASERTQIFIQIYKHSGLMKWWTVDVPCKIGTAAYYTGWFTSPCVPERTQIYFPWWSYLPLQNGPTGWRKVMVKVMQSRDAHVTCAT